MGVGLFQQPKSRLYVARCACGWASESVPRDLAQEDTVAHLETCRVPTVSGVTRVKGASRRAHNKLN